jgi:ketosteroid isomerase-like protein
MARLAVVVAVAAGVVLGVSQLAFTGADPGAEPRAAVEAYANAISARDLDGCMAMFARETEPIVLGTGPGERWIGHEEIADAHRHFLETFDTEHSERTWGMGAMRGDVAWGAGMFAVTQYLKNVKNEFFLNITMVLVREGGEWRIALAHFSNLTGAEQPPAQGGPQVARDQR